MSPSPVFSRLSKANFIIIVSNSKTKNSIDFLLLARRQLDPSSLHKKNKIPANFDLSSFEVFFFFLVCLQSSNSDLTNPKSQNQSIPSEIKIPAVHCLSYGRYFTPIGLVPVIQYIKYDGRTLKNLEAVETLKNCKLGKGQMEGSVGVWVPKPLMKLYIDCCKRLSEQPNLKVLKKLYNLEVSEDEVIVSDCELQDISVKPLLDALNAHKRAAVLDLSHNLLGNGTVERLNQVFTSSMQSYGALVLDLHCNRLGPSALFQEVINTHVEKL